MAFFDEVLQAGLELAMRIWRQLERSWNELHSRMLARIGLIIGVYLLVRPLFVKLIDWSHKRSEKKKDHKKKRQAKAKTSPNMLRFGSSNEVKPDSDDDLDSEDGQPTRTGAVLTEEEVDRKARRRLRRVQRAREDEEDLQKFAEEEWEDPDVEDLLIGRA